MYTIHDARSVNPDTVTDEQLAAVFAEYGITPAPAPVPDFFQAGRTYRRGADLFRCQTVGVQSDGAPIALGYMPINLGSLRTWEVMFQGQYDWGRGWTEMTA